MDMEIGRVMIALADIPRNFSLTISDRDLVHTYLVTLVNGIDVGNLFFESPPLWIAPHELQLDPRQMDLDLRTIFERAGGLYFCLQGEIDLKPDGQNYRLQMCVIGVTTRDLG